MTSRESLKKILLFSLIALIIVPVSIVHAQMNLLDKKDVIIIFDEGLKDAAEKAAGLYPGIKADLERTFGWKIDFEPGIILIKDHNTFQKMSGNMLIVAYALPDDSVMVIDYSKMLTDPFTLEATIKHELCHLLLHNKTASVNLPRWLDEGVAQWASGGLADIVMAKRSILDEAFRQDRLIGLKYLSEGFPSDDYSLMLAYAEGRSFVEYLARENGPQGIIDLLNRLKDGDEIEEAITKAYSRSFSELEAGWVNDLGKSTVWISILINNLYEIIFFLAAAALVLGFLRVRRRKRRYWEDEGGTEDTDSIVHKGKKTDD